MKKVNLNFKHLRIFINKQSCQRKKHTTQADRLLFKSKLNYNRFYEIDGFVKSQKIYLEPSLTLKSLAGLFNISEGYISQLINHFSRQSFTDYVNKLRVEEAKKMLGDEAYYNYTIASIGMEAGFNSKSTFYSAFKRHTGLSPTGYMVALTSSDFYKKEGSVKTT